jgi:hypothetical protein
MGHVLPKSDTLKQSMIRNPIQNDCQNKDKSII